MHRYENMRGPLGGASENYSLQNILLEKEFVLYGGLPKYRRDDIGSSLLSSLQNSWRNFLKGYSGDRGFDALSEPETGTLALFEQYFQMVSDITPQLTARIKSLEPEEEILKNVISKLFNPSKKLINNIQKDCESGRRETPVLYASKDDSPYEVDEFVSVTNNLSRCYDELFRRYDSSRMRYRLLVQNRRLGDFIRKDTLPYLDLFLDTWDSSFPDTRPTIYARILGCVIDAYQPPEERVFTNLRKRIEEKKKLGKYHDQIFREELLKVPVEGVKRVILFEDLSDLQKLEGELSTLAEPTQPDLLKVRADKERIEKYTKQLEESVAKRKVGLNCNPHLLKMRINRDDVKTYRDELADLYLHTPNYVS